MLPKPPPRSGQVGFLYLPPFRVQGVSVAGEQTAIHIPELGLGFDIGLCPRPILSAQIIALTHGHMDHVAGLPYYFSQRVFQKIGTGTCVCHHSIAGAIQNMVGSWVDLEQQNTPYKIIPLKHGESIQIKPNVFLKGLEAKHTVPAMSYVVTEHRNKLKSKFKNLPQTKLKNLKSQGEKITNTVVLPLVACTGDTQISDHLFDVDFCEANIVITECTFFEEKHRDRALIGKHLHIHDVVELLSVWKAKHVVITHTTRRTTMDSVRQKIKEVVPKEHWERVHLLMDHRTNRSRYEKQVAELGEGG